MNLRFLGFGILLLALLLVAASSIAGTVPLIAVADVTLSQGNPTTETYLLPLAVPDPGAISLPPDAKPWQAGVLAEVLVAQQAGPVLQELGRLKTMGRVASFELQPDLDAVKVSVARDSPQLASLASLPGATAPMRIEAGQTCAAQASLALEEVLRARIETSLLASLAPAGVARTNPSIDLYLASPAASASAYSYIYGSTEPKVAMNMRVLRGGSVVATAATTSTTDGSYAFYPSYNTCSTYSSTSASQTTYQWVLQPGDVVEVTASGRTVTTVVAPLSAWMDPFADVVAGNTAAGRTMEIVVSKPSAQDRCSVSTYPQTLPAAGDGTFTTNWSGQVDFDNSGLSRICARDAAGNGPCAAVPAFHVALSPLNLDPAHPVLIGQVKPKAAFVVRRLRNGATLYETSGQAGQTGYLRVDGWGQSALAGDIAQISSDGKTMEYALSPLSAALDYVADEVTGEAAASRLVRATFVKRGLSSALRTSCTATSSCRSTMANSAGKFAVAAPFDVARGDYASLVFYDATGNYQEMMPVNSPAILVDPYRAVVRAYWAPPGVSGLDFRLLSNDSVKASGSATVAAWDGLVGFGVPYFSVVAGDRVEIKASDSATIQSMTVQPITAVLDAATGHVTGYAPQGRLLAVPFASRCDPAQSGIQATACREQNVTEGNYDWAFPTLDFRAGDSVDAVTTGPDSHYTSASSDVFEVQFSLGGYYVYGSTTTRGATVTAKLYRGGVKVADCTGQSLGYWYSCYWDTGLGLISAGDTLEVTSTDGGSASLLVPELTAEGATGPARIYGKSPSGQLAVISGGEEVRVYADDQYHQSAYMSYGSALTTSDAGGRYTASFAGGRFLTTASASVCLPANPASPCNSRGVAYCYPAGHRAYYSTGPAQLGPDEFEFDSTQANAKPYTGVQHHTLFWFGDEDWVQFEVPTDDVAKEVPYLIRTFNLASGALHDMTLYGADGQSMLREWRVFSQEGQPSSTSWTPQVAGTYYLRISRPSEAGPLFCGDVYDLEIAALSKPVYLPLIVR